VFIAFFYICAYVNNYVSHINIPLIVTQTVTDITLLWDRCNFQVIVHTGHEFVMCLQGLLEYTVEGKKYILGQGDSLLFAARLRHCWRNPGNTVSKVIIVLCGFEEFESPAEYHVSA
jgi:mannose-6-phosphate isomerase-like protein (cupin superfamily)